MEKIYLSSPHMNGTEISYIQDAFDKNWVAPLGENVTGFENDLEKYMGDGSCVAALNSGTSALHLALILSGVKPGDEVLCQSFTFCASSNPIMYCGARPIFIGSELDTWGMCPDHLDAFLSSRQKLGKLPKAVVVVHLYGCSVKIEEICNVCKKYDVKLIEDAAEALGSSYNSKKLGTFGDYGVLSFNGNKIITTSGGGALVTKSESEKDKAIFLATQARDKEIHYEHSSLGFNYRLSNISAGIGRGQMTTLDQWVDKRRSNYEFYKTELASLHGFVFQKEIKNSFSNRWLTALTIEGYNYDKLKDLLTFLNKASIEARVLWKPMHMQPIYEGYEYYGERHEEELFNKGICLPSGSNLSQEQLYYIVNNIKKYFK